jgi:hypothetical protein
VTSRMSQTALIVLSSDKYKALWPIFFSFQRRNWADCNYPIYLFSNTERFDDTSVQTVLSGRDLDWSSSIRRCLTQIEQTHLLCIMDDMFLTAPVQSEHIDSLVELGIAGEAAHIHLRPYQYSGARTIPDSSLVRLDERARFRLSLYGMSFWKRQFMLDMLRDGESAWFFEVNGSRRSKEHQAVFATKNDVVPGISHGLEKGEWLPEGVAALHSIGLSPTALKFPLQNLSPMRVAWRAIKRQIGLWLPLSIQAPLQRVLFGLYRLFGYVK